MEISGNTERSLIFKSFFSKICKKSVKFTKAVANIFFLDSDKSRVGEGGGAGEEGVKYIKMSIIKQYFELRNGFQWTKYLQNELPNSMSTKTQFGTQQIACFRLIFRLQHK